MGRQVSGGTEDTASAMSRNILMKAGCLSDSAVTSCLHRMPFSPPSYGVRLDWLRAGMVTTVAGNVFRAADLTDGIGSEALFTTGSLELFCDASGRFFCMYAP